MLGSVHSPFTLDLLSINTTPPFPQPTPLVIATWTVLITMHQWGSFVTASDSHSKAAAATTEVTVKRKSITHLLLLLSIPSPEHGVCQNPCPCQILTLGPAAHVSAAAILAYVLLSTALKQMTLWLQTTATQRRVLQSLKIPLTRCVMISQVFTWPSGSLGFHSCGSHSQQRHLLLRSLVCCHLKMWLPACSASLPLPGNRLRVPSSTLAEVPAHFCQYSN